MICHNVKDAVETAIMNIIEDIITNDIEEEQRRKNRVRQENPNYWDSTWGHIYVTGPYPGRSRFLCNKEV